MAASCTSWCVHSYLGCVSSCSTLMVCVFGCVCAIFKLCCYKLLCRANANPIAPRFASPRAELAAVGAVALRAELPTAQTQLGTNPRCSRKSPGCRQMLWRNRASFSWARGVGARAPSRTSSSTACRPTRHCSSSRRIERSSTTSPARHSSALRCGTSQGTWTRRRRRSIQSSRTGAAAGRWCG